MRIDPVEQRSGDSLAVPGDGVLVAPAVPDATAIPPAGARVRCGDELKVCGKHDRAASPCKHHLALFEYLAERLQRSALELGQLVEKEDSKVCQRDLSRTRWSAAAEQSGPRRTVVWRAKRARAN